MQKTTKILLISVNQQKSPYPVYPIGLSYLATFLREANTAYHVTLCDLNLTDLESCLHTIKQYQPDFTGISLRNIDDVNFYNQTNYIHSYKELITRIKEETTTTVILGGAGYSIFPEELFTFLQPHFAVQGEGEQAFKQLIECLTEGHDYSRIDGLVYENDKAVVMNGHKSLRDSYKFQLNFEKPLTDYYWKYSGMINIQTKRGCPNRCIYCTYPLIEGKNVRTQQIDTVIDTIEKIYTEQNIDYFFFTDSLFNLHNDYNHDLCESIIRKGLKIKWGAYFSPDNLNKELLTLFKEAGLTHVEFGTESLSDTTLEAYQKNFTVADIINSSQLCNQLYIDFAHFLILAGYGETETTIKESFSNCQKIDRSVFFPFIGMRIYPGTPLQQIAIDEKIITEDTCLLDPVYYVSKQVNIDTLKDQANETGKSWIFPDQDHSDLLLKMRLRNKKGPLWEYLIK